MIQVFKKHELSNSLSMFLYYKQATGSTIERDIELVKKQQEVLADKNSSEETKEKASKKIDALEVLTNVYYSMRCAAEGERLDYNSTISEVALEDLHSDEFSNILSSLLDVKKKQSGFLKKHLRK